MLKYLSFLALIYFLFEDFKSTKGFIKAKVLQSLSLGYLMYGNYSALAYLGSLLRRGGAEFDQHHVAVGFLSADASVTLWILRIITGCFLWYATFKLAKRDDYFRVFMLKILPFATIIDGFIIYRSFVLGGDEGYHHLLILLVGMAIAGVINGLLYNIYRSKLMKNYFSEKTKSLALN